MATSVPAMLASEFAALINRIASAARNEKARMESNRLELMRLYSAAKADPDPVRGAKTKRALEPVIHQNSVIRMRYRDLSAKFNTAVTATRDILKRAGITLESTGLAAAPIAVPVVAAAAALTAWAIVEGIKAANNAQASAIRLIGEVYHDPNATDAEKEAARRKILELSTDPPPPGDPWGLGSLTPLLGIVAIILLGPPILEAMRSRRAAA